MPIDISLTLAGFSRLYRWADVSRPLARGLFDMRKTLTDKGVTALKPRSRRYAAPDPQLTGHYVRVQPSGAKSYVTVARSPTGKQVWTTIAACDVMGIDEARERAREAIKRVRAGLAAVEPASAGFAEVAEQWLAR